LSLNDNGACSSNALLRHVNSSFSSPEKRADGSNPPEKDNQGLKKTGSTHDIAALIRFLASDGASFITGQTIFQFEELIIYCEVSLYYYFYSRISFALGVQF
jgi:NAD(P)-dependent dehydrogenase (short-subunit alcohol dehydrogenase family)